ncbi:hypothetical protein IG631_16596 [Alternaria alternata]|nr:hypothetical protein IG631_16596 [Alternaria alternata]
MSVEVWRAMRREEMRREDPRQYLKLGPDSGTHDGLLASGPLRGAWRLTEGGKIRLQHQSCDKAAGEQIAIGIGIGTQAKVIRRSDARRLIVRSSARLSPTPQLQTLNIVGHRDARYPHRNAMADGGAQSHGPHLLEARRSFFSRPMRNVSHVASGRVKFPLFKQDRGFCEPSPGQPTWPQPE